LDREEAQRGDGPAVAEPPPPPPPTSGTVTVDGVALGYDVHGSGPDTVVLLPALLISRRMQEPLARSLALRRIRVICLDYLGERADGTPQEPWRFSTDRLAAQTLAALDELGIERAVIGGTSIGSSIALEAMIAAPERFSGVLLEGPFLDHAAYAMGLGVSALFALVTLGGPVIRAAARASSAVRVPGVGRLGRRLGVPGTKVSEDPARAAAFLQGLVFGRMGPPWGLRLGVGAPALVIGFPVDPFHPMSDAVALARELPDARLIRTSSIADLRLRPERLAGEIARFVGDCRRRDAAGRTGSDHEIRESA
jgi:pimeloyl-ACP methyl ester carboxylesterase